MLTRAKNKDFVKLLEIMNAQISMLTAEKEKEINNLFESKNAKIAILMAEKELEIDKLNNFIIGLEALVTTLKQTVKSQKEILNA
jgi:hypothetical protein